MIKNFEIWTIIFNTESIKKCLKIFLVQDLIVNNFKKIIFSTENDQKMSQKNFSVSECKKKLENNY